MTLRLVMVRTVDGNDVAESFDDAIRSQIERAVRDTNDATGLAALESFRRYFEVGEVPAETEITFACGSHGTADHCGGWHRTSADRLSGFVSGAVRRLPWRGPDLGARKKGR